MFCVSCIWCICNSWVELVEPVLRNFTFIWKFFYLFFYLYKLSKRCVYGFMGKSQKKKKNSLWHYFLGSELTQFLQKILNFFFLLSCRFATFGALFLLEVPLNLWRVCINVNHSLRGYPIMLWCGQFFCCAPLNFFFFFWVNMHPWTLWIIITA